MKRPSDSVLNPVSDAVQPRQWSDNLLMSYSSHTAQAKIEAPVALGKRCGVGDLMFMTELDGVGDRT